MSEATSISEILARGVERANASIVRVNGRRRQAASGIVWSADGLIVTAHHVVQSDEGVTVGLPNGDNVNAQVVGRDPTTDLALLRAEAQGLTPPTWLAADELRVGHLVLALGRPGQNVQATLGVISALGGPWRTGAGGKVDRYVQTDVLMYPGFSGGPLVTESGAMAGLNSSALGRGVSLSLPSATIHRVVDSLLAHGRVRRGYIGVGIQPVQLPQVVAEKLNQPSGLLVNSVEDGSPAALGGLLLGDVLVSVDGEAVPRPEALSALLTGDRVGQPMAVRILRGGVVQEFPITVGER